MEKKFSSPSVRKVVGPKPNSISSKREVGSQHRSAPQFSAPRPPPSPLPRLHSRLSERKICRMNKGHIYFEIQADDPGRAVNFYSKVFGWKFDEIAGLPVPYWTIATGGSRGG